MTDARDFMIPVKKSERHRQLHGGLSLHAKLFVFFDKNTGAPRFEIKADHDGGMPTDEAASLLAVHCVARHQIPGDFGVLVGTNEDLINGLVKRTTRLIESCSVGPASASPARLTQRQNEVLIGIRLNLANKEIASRLNVSERTVKFHVSALLDKFQVRRRGDLLLEVEGCLPALLHKRETKAPTPSKRAAILSVPEITPTPVSQESGSSSRIRQCVEN